MKQIIMNSVFSVAIISILLYGLIVFWASNEQFYLKQFEQNNASDVINITEEELIAVNNVVVDYIFNRRDNIYITVASMGYKHFYNDREIMHMKDVKHLFNIGKYFVYFNILTSLSICIYFYKKKSLADVLKKSLYFNWFFVTVAVILSFVIYSNFNYFFIKFHQLFFNNDLWILDPNKDMMINMYTLDFFINISRNIFITFIALLSLYSISINIIYKRNKT